MPAPFLSALAPADALAFSMVALLSFALGMIVTIFFTMARSGSSGRDVDTEVFDEEEEADRGSFNVEAGEQPKESPREEWELDPDWWKK